MESNDDGAFLAAPAGSLAETLMRAMLGDQYDHLMRSKTLADDIRQRRTVYEDSLDALLAMYRNTERVEPQELRAGATIASFRTRDEHIEDGVMIIFALAMERLATLPEPDQRRTREFSTEQASPLGTMPGGAR
jgi:hypothetical protein